MGAFRRLTLSAAALLLGISAVVAEAQPAVACSCVASWPQVDDQPPTMLFLGLVGEEDRDRGIPVAVERWWVGPADEPVVWLGTEALDRDSSSCGTPRPRPGSRWIFATSFATAMPLSVNACTQQGQVGTDPAAAILEAAMADYGEGVALDPAAEDPEDPLLGMLWILVAVGLALGLLGIVVFAARRQDLAGP